MKLVHKIIFALVLAALCPAYGQDPELTNWRSGIDMIPGLGDGSDKGTAYYEEYLYYDKLIDDQKIIYLKGNTPITLIHNARNRVKFGGSDAYANYLVGANGPDGVPNSGDEGTIRYRIDRDRQIKGKWAPVYSGDAAVLYPAYTGPFTLDSQQYGFGDAVNVVGTTGHNGGDPSNYASRYYRGILDQFGDEWHSLSYADDSNVTIAAIGAWSTLEKDRADDGKSVLLVVNPKTPCFTARVTGTGQFVTTAPKAYWSPRVVAQTTYISPGSAGTVTIELRDINGNNVFYRINGGSFTNAGASTVTLTDSQFNSGSNTLEYYYAGNAAYTKTRTVVKNPGYPSNAETHGYALFGSPTKYAQMVTRCNTVGTLAYALMNSVRTNGSFSASNHTDWFLTYRNGGRRASGHGSGAMALKNALVAKVNGFTYTKSGEPRSYGQVAKEMLMDSILQMDPIGLENNINSEAVPTREIYYRGYWDAEPVYSMIFAYDIMIADFKASQVTGGITEIEDIYIREKFARYAYSGMQLVSIGSGGYEAPGMWVGSQMTAGAIVAMIMPKYSSILYGSSGADGTVTTTYPDCPYPDEQWTWAQALIEKRTQTGFPNVRYGLTWTDNDSTKDSLILNDSFMVGSYLMPYASWGAKFAYLSDTQMAYQVQLLAHMFKTMYPQYERQRIRDFILLGAQGNIYVTQFESGSPYTVSTQVPNRKGWLLLLNDNWPEIAALNTAWVQSLDHTSIVEKWESDDYNFSAFAVPLYDPTYYGGADVTAPTLTTATIPAGGTTTVFAFSEPVTWGAGGSGGWTLSLSGGACTLTYLSGQGTSTLVYSNSRTVGSGESGTKAFTQPGAGIGDPSGNALANISVSAITIVGAGDSTLPTISITAPSGNATVTSPNYTLFAGTAADNVGVTSVTWSNSTGGTGTATGTTSWTIPVITLQPGDNIISIQSHDAAGNLSVAATRTITYNPPSSGSTQTHTDPRNRRLFGR